MLAWPEEVARIERRRAEDWATMKKDWAEAWRRRTSRSSFTRASLSLCRPVLGGVGRGDPQCRMWGQWGKLRERRFSSGKGTFIQPFVHQILTEGLLLKCRGEIQ